MKNFLFCLVALLCLSVFTACNKDQDENLLEEPTLEMRLGLEEEAETRIGERFRKSCFKIVTPITVVMPDGTTITGDDRQALKEEIKAWYEANPDSQEKPTLQYPIDVELGDGEVVTVMSRAELIELKKWCIKDRFDKKCFDIVFPISLTMPDGSTISGESKEELRNAMKDWYIANPDTQDKPSLNFPIEVVYDDETTASANSKEELFALRKACFEN